MPWETIREKYDDIKQPASKSLKCTGCGRRVRRQRQFSQTRNPFNKNAAGEVKTYQEIRAELIDQARAWEKIPVICGQCQQEAMDIVQGVFAEAGLDPNIARWLDETADGRDVFLSMPHGRPPTIADIEVAALMLDDALGSAPGTVKTIRAPRGDVILRLVTRQAMHEGKAHGSSTDRK